MKKASPKLSLDRSATYKIKVPGILDERWSDWADGVTVESETDGEGSPVTILTGTIDQATLHGLLRQLYALGLPLISVVCLDYSPDNYPVASAKGRYDSGRSQQ